MVRLSRKYKRTSYPLGSDLDDAFKAHPIRTSTAPRPRVNTGIAYGDIELTDSDGDYFQPGRRQQKSEDRVLGWLAERDATYLKWMKEKGTPLVLGAIGALDSDAYDTHMARLKRIKKIHEREAEGSHRLSNALLSLSYYTAKKNLSDKKVTAAEGLCKQVCDLALAEGDHRNSSIPERQQALHKLSTNNAFAELKEERGVANIARNVLLGAACLLGIGLIAGGLKRLITGSFFFRADGAAKRRAVLNAGSALKKTSMVFQAAMAQGVTSYDNFWCMTV